MTKLEEDVREAISNAIDNGYDPHSWSVVELSIDLLSFATTFDEGTTLNDIINVVQKIRNEEK